MKLTQMITKPHRSLKTQTADTTDDSPLATLEQATRVVLKFEQKHQQIFETYRAMLEEVSVAEDAVKTYVRQNKRNLEGELFTVEYGEGFSKWYDPDTVIHITSKQLDLDRNEAAGLLAKSKVVAAVASVDMKKLKQFAKLNDIDFVKFQKAYRQEQTQTRATIKRKA